MTDSVLHREHHEIPADWQGLSYHDLNALLNLYDEDGLIQFGADREAARQYFLQNINQNTVFFHDLEEKINYLLENDYYDETVIGLYDFQFIKELTKKAYSYKFRFPTFLGAFKFYSSYALKTFDGQRYLERFEDRVVMNALFLANGDKDLAENLVDKMITGQFQPATPTFLNAGKKQRGEHVSCFLLNLSDDMESIGRAINSSLQLSRRGGGVALCLSNLRESGAPIKKMVGQSSGVIPVMKLLEDSFSYANQLGQRQGAGAVYLHAHHPDIMSFLDTKRENADEKIRIKSLSLGVVVPDITFELAKKNEDMYLFSPYDVERVYGRPFAYVSVSEEYYNMVDDGRIKKTKINAREFFQTVAEIQFESGYPFIMFEDTVNRANNVPGKIVMSNLCLTGDTRIMMKDGSYQTLEILWRQGGRLSMGDDVNPEHMTILQSTAGHGETLKYRPGVIQSFATQVVRTRESADVYEVRGFDGLSIKGTADHKLAVVGAGHAFTWKRIIDIQPGDELVMYNGFSKIVTAVEFVGQEDVYDLTVPDGHTFIANGVISHNCSEILQPSELPEFNTDLSYRSLGKDISCNLGSLNIASVMDSGDIGSVVEASIRALTTVSDVSSLDSVPSVREGNARSHAVGLGQMNLHGYLARERVHYGSPEALDFTNMYFYTVAYHCVRASMLIAKERGQVFDGFEQSKYKSGEYFEKYINRQWTFESERARQMMSGVDVPTSEDWAQLARDVAEHGMYHQNLQAVPPTGSISYINGSTSSIHPIASQIEIRKEGKLGRVYYPAPFLTNDNREFFEDAYAIGFEKIIDTYAVAQQHVDQGMSLTLFFNSDVTTRDLNRAYIYAWRKGIKTLYYIRLRQMALEGTEVEGCVSCML